MTQFDLYVHEARKARSIAMGNIISSAFRWVRSSTSKFLGALKIKRDNKA